MLEIINFVAETVGTVIQGGVANVGGVILTVMFSLMAIEFKRLSR